MLKMQLNNSQAYSLSSNLLIRYRNYSYCIISSVEHLNCNKEQYTNAIIESLSLTSVDDTNLISSGEPSESINQEVVDKMSEEQKLVLRSIELHSPKIKSDLLVSYQSLIIPFLIYRNYLNEYSFPVSINLPKLKIPIQYYEKKSEMNLVMDPQFVDIVEIDLYNYVYCL